MSGQDARFEDAADSPLRIQAVDADDVVVFSALTQDSVFTPEDVSYNRTRRELAILLNRFRWEDKESADEARRDYERVRSVLLVKDAMDVEAAEIGGSAGGTVLSLLAIEFDRGVDGTGKIVLTLSGDREIIVDVECVNATITDVSRPYRAPSRKSPSHG